MSGADGWDATEPDGSGGGLSELANVPAGGNGGSPIGPDNPACDIGA